MHLLIAIILMFTCVISAQQIQPVDDSINIRVLLIRQINEIKARDSIRQQKFYADQNKYSGIGTANNIRQSLFKPFLILESGLIAVLLVLWRRKKIRESKYHKQILKKNIRKLREEKIGSNIDKKSRRVKEFMN